MMKLTHLANAKLKDGTFKNIKLKDTVRSAIPTCCILAESEIQRVSAFLMVKIDTLLNPSRLYLLPQCMMVGGLPFKRILREKPGGQGLSDNGFNFNCR